MMLSRQFPGQIGTSRKNKVMNIILVANAFIWYFCAINFLKSSIDPGFSNFEVLMIWGVNFVGIAASAILGATAINRLNRRLPFLLYWMLAGVFLSLILVTVEIGGTQVFMIVSAVLGTYFGIGMPICMGHYAAATEVGNRAKLGGITFLLIGLGSFLLSYVGFADTILSVSILGIWRLSGLITLVLLKPDEKQIDVKDRISYRYAISNRSFLFYFIPWCMFSIVNSLALSANNNLSEDLIYNSTIIENILAGTSALVSGFFADFVGRKRLALSGFALLGVGYAVLGLFPGNSLGWWFYTSIDGVAWGTFCTIFIITLWGDLAQGRSSEKYYAIGSLPYLFSTFIRLSVGAYIAAGISELAVFSFASFFLFLAVLPLVQAPETLPEKTMKDRELKIYVEQAKKVKEKYA